MEASRAGAHRATLVPVDVMKNYTLNVMLEITEEVVVTLLRDLVIRTHWMPSYRIRANMPFKRKVCLSMDEGPSAG